jgi:CHAT domain-containing protein
MKLIYKLFGCNENAGNLLYFDLCFSGKERTGTLFPLSIMVALVLLPLRAVLPNPFEATQVLAQDQTTQIKAEQLFTQGIDQYQKSQFQAALGSWQQALQSFRGLNNSQGEQAALGNIGLAYNALGDYTQAVQYYQQQLALAKHMGNPQAEANALGNLGNTYRALGYYVKALEHQQQCLAIMRKLHNLQGEGQTLANMANVYEVLGDYSKAIDLHQQSLKIARSINNDRGSAASLSNLGTLESSLQHYREANDYYQQSLTLARKIGDRLVEANTLNNLGSIHHVQRNFNQAILFYQQSLAIAQAIQARSSEGVALGGLGLAYDSLGNYPKAIVYHQKSVAIAQQIGDRRAEALSLNNFGHTLLVSGQPQQAEGHLRNALQVLDAIRADLTDLEKISVFDTQFLTYNLLQQVLIAQKKVEAALEASEWGRARAFVDSLAARVVNQSSIQQVTKPLTIQQIQDIAKAQKATVVEYSIIPNEFIAQGKQRGLDAELYIWVVQPSGKIDFRKVNLLSLNLSLKDLVASNRTSLGIGGRGSSIDVVPIDNAKPGEQLKHLRQLYDLLITPIATLLPNNPNTRIIFIPQGELFQVPFPALQDTDGKLLIEKYTVSTAPAVQVLQLTRQQQQKVLQSSLKEALVVGNPTMPKVKVQPNESPQPLPPLPSAEKEAIEVAKLFKTNAFIGSQATKTAIISKFTTARIVHLATHGLLDDFRRSGMPGAIALAPSGTGAANEGLLTSNEIIDLKLNAELVVLSACDTGRGSITGDGVIGLSRSLVIAGVPSVIVSLWSVPDAPTAELMVEFYRNWQERKMDKAQALREAMLTTMKTHPNPRDWAAFTLIGEAD